MGGCPWRDLLSSRFIHACVGAGGSGILGHLDHRTELHSSVEVAR